MERWLCLVLLEHFNAIMAFHVTNSVVVFNGLNDSFGSLRAVTNSSICCLLDVDVDDCDLVDELF